MIVKLSRQADHEEWAQIDLSCLLETANLLVVSRLRASRTTRYQSGEWIEEHADNPGSEGLTLTPDGSSIVSVEAIEGACFSGVFYARSLLSHPKIHVFLDQVTGRVQPQHVGGFASAAAIGVAAAIGRTDLFGEILHHDGWTLGSVEDSIKS